MTVLTPTRGDERLIEELVQEHADKDGAKLQLALTYTPSDRPDELVLFEIIQGFADNSVSYEEEFVKVWIGPATGIQLDSGRDLYISLTSTAEFQLALQNGWKSVGEILAAIPSVRIVRSTDDGNFFYRQLKNRAGGE